MFTAFMRLYDAWQERRWRKQKFISDVRPPVMNEMYIMASIGRVKVLLRFES